MKISIVTPSYNQGRFIERTIKSVIEQKKNNYDLEYVVFDGGSDDETTKILEKYNSELRWVSERDGGQGDAVNKGILATNGGIIGWINSDDIYYPDAVVSALDFFEKNPNVDVVYGNANHIDVDDRFIEKYPAENWDFNRMMETCIICQPAAFFRRTAVDRFGLIDANLRYCMDYEFWLRLGKRGARFQHIPDLLAGSRMYQENKTLGSREKVHKEINGMFKNTFGEVPDKWIMNYAHARVEEYIERTKSPNMFVLNLLAVTLLSSLYWNKTISKGMRGHLYQWVSMIMKKST
jgi:glycosyltransferase involved in cell wall biosynthesis